MRQGERGAAASRAREMPVIRRDLDYAHYESSEFFSSRDEGAPCVLLSDARVPPPFATRVDPRRDAPVFPQVRGSDVFHAVPRASTLLASLLLRHARTLSLVLLAAPAASRLLHFFFPSCFFVVVVVGLLLSLSLSLVVSIPFHFHTVLREEQRTCSLILRDR